MSNSCVRSAILESPAARPAASSKVLLLDCPRPVQAALEGPASADRLTVVAAATAAAAIAELRRTEMPVLVDFGRGAATLQVVRELRTQMPNVQLFALVDPARPDLAAEAVLAGAADVLPAPLVPARLGHAIRREQGLAAGAAQAGPVVDELYAFGAAMRGVAGQIAQAAAGRAGVFIHGEHGTGREVVARAIHAASAAARPGAFVVVDCAASDPDALGMELFGVAPRADENLPVRELERISGDSRIAAAAGGTLFLRHVSDAPTRVQRRLARLLRDREAVLVETGALTPVDVRCMVVGDGATDAALADGALHQDLYRRFAATRIDMPPLRDRREDIPVIANRLQRAICAELEIAPKVFSRSALALLGALPWTGNVAELDRLLRAVLRALPSRGIGVEDVLAHVRLAHCSVSVASGGTLRQARLQFEQQYIATVLRQHRGRITQAAKALGIQRTNLYRKMRTLKVPQPHR